MKGKLATIIIILATLVLAGIAVFTAIRLYNIRQEAVAPNVPTSVPAAQEITDAEVQTSASCILAFSLNVTTTPVKKICNQDCSVAADCESHLTCYQGKCRLNDCHDETDCDCTTGTSTPTTPPTATPTLPAAGVSTPTILGIGIGTLLLVISFVLAL